MNLLVLPVLTLACWVFCSEYLVILGLPGPEDHKSSPFLPMLLLHGYYRYEWFDPNPPPSKVWGTTLMSRGCISYPSCLVFAKGLKNIVVATALLPSLYLLNYLYTCITWACQMPLKIDTWYFHLISLFSGNKFEESHLLQEWLTCYHSKHKLLRVYLNIHLPPDYPNWSWWCELPTAYGQEPTNLSPTHCVTQD